MRFYHVSDNPNLNNMLIKPRVPMSRMSIEDRHTPRICVSNSINGCLTATDRWCEGEILTVYMCESVNFIQPDTHKVIDAPLTGECWILEPVTFKYFSTITIEDVLSYDLNAMPNNLYAFSVTPEHR